MRAAALCNGAVLHDRDKTWTLEGDPMEGAQLALSKKLKPDGPGHHSSWARTGVIPFDARHRYMATLHHDPEGKASIHV